jgi:hypothetical protein
VVAIAVFCLAVGGLMVVQWLVSLASGGVPELETQPFAIGFHLAAEALTAALLAAAGIGLLRRVAWWKGVALVALGALLYTVVNSSGYFAEAGVWPMVGVFAVLAVVALTAVRALLTPP